MTIGLALRHATLCHARTTPETVRGSRVRPGEARTEDGPARPGWCRRPRGPSGAPNGSATGGEAAVRFRELSCARRAEWRMRIATVTALGEGQINQSDG